MGPGARGRGDVERNGGGRLPVYAGGRGGAGRVDRGRQGVPRDPAADNERVVHVLGVVRGDDAAGVVPGLDRVGVSEPAAADHRQHSVSFGTPAPSPIYTRIRFTECVLRYHTSTVGT